MDFLSQRICYTNTIEVENEEEQGRLLDVLIDKIKAEPVFSETYTTLICRIFGRETESSLKVKFRKNILGRVKRLFDKSICDRSVKEGFLQFIGDMYNAGLISHLTINNTIFSDLMLLFESKLPRNNESEREKAQRKIKERKDREIIGLSIIALLTRVGKKLFSDGEKSFHVFLQYMLKRFHDVKEKCSSQFSCALADFKDLKENNFKDERTSHNC